MTSSSDPPAGACPRCRKEAPLTAGEGGLVLGLHHTVLGGTGYEAAACRGTGEAPAQLDDSADWAWQPPPATRQQGDAMTRVRDTLRRNAEAQHVAGDVWGLCAAVLTGDGIRHYCCRTPSQHSTHRCGACTAQWQEEEG